jgi:hypothetical protein
MTKKILIYVTLPLLLLLSISSGNSAPQSSQSAPAGFNAGPDIIAGNMADLYVDGTVGTQNGLAMAVTSCNTGNTVVNFFAMPSTNHPAIAQNLYRMSGGSANDERFEQIGQAWVKHTYGAEQANSCFSCQPGGDFNHLGVGCSDTYFNFQSAVQGDLGSRAWINPFTGVFQSNARDHTGHNHTAVSHMIVVESADLNTALNPGATYYAELLYVTPDEYAWCQTHPGQCNMYNNASYLRYNLTGTTNFTFSAVGSPVRMTPAVNAWPGATIIPIEPVPGVDGRAYLAFKVTGPVAGVWHYEYAIYNENLDRGIQSFSVPMLLLPGVNGSGPGPQNIQFHAPPQHPGFANDGTQGDAGFSSAEWSPSLDGVSLTWSSETFVQNQNANAIRWGTLYNFRFDSNAAPQAADATIGFFKTGAPITVAIQGPGPTGGPSPTPGTPTPTPTPTPPATPTPTPGTSTPTPTPAGTPTTPTPTPTPAAQPLNLSTRMFVQTGDNVGIGGFIVTGTTSKHVVIRAVGPSLVGLPNPLVDPVLELHGPPGFPILINDNCADTQIPPPPPFCQPGSLEAALEVHLDPGAYTAIVRGKNNTSGVALVEVYDIDQGAASKLANISTRALIGTSDDIVIAGFILGGNSGNDLVLLRGIGPSLAAAGVPNALADPTLELRDNNGVLLVANDNWQDDPTMPVLPPTSPLESAIMATLPPGLYTALLAGVNNGIGIGLVEVYDLGAP